MSSNICTGWSKNVPQNFCDTSNKYLLIFKTLSRTYSTIICNKMIVKDPTTLGYTTLWDTCISFWILIFCKVWQLLVICSRNRVPGPGSKIHYPVPNPGNWYPVFALITWWKMQCWPAFISVYNLCDDFDFTLSLRWSLLFLMTYVFTFHNSITDLDIEKNHRFVKNIR